MLQQGISRASASLARSSLRSFSSAPVSSTTDVFWDKLSSSSANKVEPHVITSGQGAYLTINGKDYLNFCSSHYLGFALESRLKEAAKSAIDSYGLGTGYRTLAGTHALHVSLEKKIAEFKGTEGAVTFTSAYAANACAVQTIMGKEDIVVSDQLNHASIIDAVRVAGVQNKFAYKHSDMEDLEAKLKEVRGEGVGVGARSRSRPRNERRAFHSHSGPSRCRPGSFRRPPRRMARLPTSS